MGIRVVTHLCREKHSLVIHINSITSMKWQTNPILIIENDSKLRNVKLYNVELEYFLNWWLLLEQLCVCWHSSCVSSYHSGSLHISTRGMAFWFSSYINLWHTDTLIHQLMLTLFVHRLNWLTTASLVDPNLFQKSGPGTVHTTLEVFYALYVVCPLTVHIQRAQSSVFPW